MLQDHEIVKQYSPVQGMAKNVFFLSHNHRENGGEDESVSKYNTFEVCYDMEIVWRNAKFVCLPLGRDDRGSCNVPASVSTFAGVRRIQY